MGSLNSSLLSGSIPGQAGGAAVSPQIGAGAVVLNGEGTQGVPVKYLDLVLFGSIAIMTGLVTRALGAMPTFALTVLPAIAVMGLRIGLRNVFILASLIGAASGAGGFIVAYLMDWSVGASQTLVAVGFLVLVRAVGALWHLKASRA